MKKYCPICFRRISTNRHGKICRHGFKKNRWIINKTSSIENNKYKKVDSSPCQGSGKYGLTSIQLERLKDDKK